MFGEESVGSELAVKFECDLGECVGAGRVGVEGLALGGALEIIDLTEIKHLTLGAAAVVETFVFHHTPVSVFLAILVPNL